MTETTNHLHHTREMHWSENRDRILYPIMLIAAIAVIIFSMVGIVTMTGVLPGALSENGQAAPQSAAKRTAAATPAQKPEQARVGLSDEASPENGRKQ